MYDSDPVPGDPYEVARLGKELRGMADEIDKQARNIKALASVDGWDSDAGRAFHEIAGDTSSRLKDAYDRYDEAATAMGTKVREGGGESSEYASELYRAQQLADKGLQEYRDAEVDYKAANKVLDPLNGKVLTGDDAVRHSKEQKKSDDAARLMLEGAKKITQAKVIRDEAAYHAARKIKNVIHHDGVRDPGGIMNWIADHADWFSAAATFLAVAALVAAVLLSGGTLAVLLVAAAGVMSATALSGRVYDYFARGGKLDLLKIGLDVLGIIPGVGAVRGLTAAAKGARLLAARNAVWSGFTNGFAVKNLNKGVIWASKVLAKKNITKIKLPKGGFEPELLTRYIKGAALVNLGVHGVVKMKNRIDDLGDSSGAGGAPSQDPQPGPTPTPTPSHAPSPPPSMTPSPSPQPSPKPRSTAFHTALAPTG
ncbi:putative T7SS-secreted protein [Streptomyces sp. NPDC048188]|uniref:putative T7SS-secreted protein n=1 Tax=Streptomyces sp. NPDC048188 TaxID=3155749 RepID=UPI00342DE1F0